MQHFSAAWNVFQFIWHQFATSTAFFILNWFDGKLIGRWFVFLLEIQLCAGNIQWKSANWDVSRYFRYNFQLIPRKILKLPQFFSLEGWKFFKKYLAVIFSKNFYPLHLKKSKLTWTLRILCIGVKWRSASAWRPTWSSVERVLVSQIFLAGHHNAWSDQSFGFAINRQ